MSEAELGRGGRLTGGSAPELVAAGHAVEAAHGPRLARGLSLSDIAHAIALHEGGAIDRETAAALLGGLLDLHAIDPAEFPWDPQVGDAFLSREHELRRRVGAAAAGWLSAGRPRREAFRVALRLTARAGALDLAEATLDLAAALADQAERHAGDLAADYTYLQPAQPSTIGHLLLAHVEPAVRDAQRLRAAHAWLDLSVAGAGGSAGSRWPLDRERLAALLGCSGVVRHAKDAMWQADGYLDLAGAVVTGLTHRAQLGQDLEIQASREFGQVSLADEHSRASALMPQKRNPYALAVMRASSGTAAGDLAALHVALHSGSARTDHFHLLNGTIPRMLEEATAVTRLAAAVAAGLTFHPEPAARAAREGFVTAADVADVVAQRGGIDYRSAHKLVGRAVRDLVEEGLPPDALTSERIARAGVEALGREVAVPDEALAEALDPLRCLASRRQTGSAAPGETEAMIADARERIAAERAWLGERRAAIAAAERDLLDLAARLAGR